MSDGRHPGQTPLNRQLDKVCDAFEAAWRAGKQPRIEDYLTKANEALRLRLLEELLLAGLDLKTCPGSELNRDEYIQRFPEFAQLIDGYLNEDHTARFSSRTVDSEAMRTDQEHLTSLSAVR